MDKIAVLIPCYNEEVTIEKVVKDFYRVLPECVVYVYDNNSTDGTPAIAAAAGAVVRHEYQQGKGNVIRRMFREIDAECYILVDGDDTYPAQFAPEMVSRILDRGMDMAVGNRLSSNYKKENKRLFHNFGNNLVCWLVNTLFHGNIKDIMTGYRAMSFQFVKTFPVCSRGFEIETEMSIHAIRMNMAIDDIVIVFHERPEGSKSKLNTFSDGIRILLTIARLFRFYRPALFYSIIALLFMAVGMFFIVPPIKACGAVDLLNAIPALMMGFLFIIASIVSIFSGLMLDSFTRRNRREFENELVKIYGRNEDLQDKTAYGRPPEI